MDYIKLRNKFILIRNEEQNLRLEIQKLEANTQNLKNILVRKEGFRNLLNLAHDAMFQSALKGLDTVRVFLTLGIEIKTKSPQMLENILTDLRARIEELFKSVGIKDVVVENMLSFKINHPNEHIPDSNSDTIISFKF